LIKYTAQIRGKEKARDLAVKDQIQKEKLLEATSCLSMVTSATNHQNHAHCGCTFPPRMPTQSHLNKHNTLGGVTIPCLICIVENVPVKSKLLYFCYYC
jgi:hypothetical protein